MNKTCETCLKNDRNHQTCDCLSCATYKDNISKNQEKYDLDVLSEGVDYLNIDQQKFADDRICIVSDSSVKEIKKNKWYWTTNVGHTFRVAWTGEIDKDYGNLICIDEHNNKWSISAEDLRSAK